jgi:2-succinyl-6-hydroxy-2,4-cyclohexadiene-1-carboxylate synthase
MKETRVKVNQLEFQIREYERDGDAIIFLHFGGANLMMWQPVVPYFQDRYRLILVDLRGHGKSDAPETGYHMDEMTRDVIGIMQKLELERANIIGSSLGAEVGLSMAANHPEKVLSLVCDGALYSEYGPYGIWQGSDADFEEHLSQELRRIQNTPEAIFPSIEMLVKRRRDILEKNGWWNEYVEAVEMYGAHKTDDGYVRSFGKQARADYIKHYYRYRFEQYYKKITCPIAILPDEDVLSNEREKTAMEGLTVLAKHAQIIEIPGWNHPYGWLLQPKPVSEAILRFLEGASI